MSKSNLINHINSLKMEVKLLTDIQKVRASEKKLDAILVFDTTIALLNKRIEKYTDELDK
tara:strand:+ start:218 stop:397 length:180 start_codon:yes stop_codon:yes gene_type:complete